MVSRKPVTWFLTDQGRKFSFGLVTSTGLALTVARFAPHTFGIEYYKDFVRYYRNGKPVDLPKELEDRYQQCLNILKVNELYRKLTQPFTVFGYDLFHAGCSSSKFGMAVGIPMNFTYKSLEDIQQSGVQVNQKEVDWKSEAGMKLSDAMILSDNVQKFALCREILMSQNNKAIFESTYPFACIFFVYNLTSYINRRLNLYAAPTLVRGTLYTIAGTFGLGIYFLLKDITEVHYEIKVDKKLAELGPEFIESGVKFYEKLMQRNQALRELMGKEGESKYSKLGNENFGLRQPRLSLMHRKQYFESLLKNNDNAKTNAMELDE